MIEILRKSWVALLVLALALIAQIPHAAHVFDRAPYLGLATQPVSLWYAWLLAYAYAIALESATLMFVVHGHQGASYGFALASFAVNLSYYAMHGVTLWNWASFPAWLLSALLPIAIASYSHILAGVQGDKDTGYRVQWPVWLRAWLAQRRQAATTVQPPLVVDVTSIQAPFLAVVETPELIALADDDSQVNAIEPMEEDEATQAEGQAEDATIDDDLQTDAIGGPLQSQLDAMNQRIVESIRNGKYTPYAISKDTGIAQTTLKRTQGDKVVGRLPKLVAMGIVRNSSGADGSEYRLVD